MPGAWHQHSLILYLACEVWGMDASTIAQAKAVEEGNRQLKRMFAEFSMQNELLKDALGKKWIGHLDAARWPGMR
jgi:hypothetical protein